MLLVRWSKRERSVQRSEGRLFMTFGYDVGGQGDSTLGLENIDRYVSSDRFVEETAKYHDHTSNSTHPHVSSTNNSAFLNLCNHFIFAQDDIGSSQKSRSILPKNLLESALVLWKYTF